MIINDMNKSSHPIKEENNFIVIIEECSLNVTCILRSERISRMVVSTYER